MEYKLGSTTIHCDITSRRKLCWTFWLRWSEIGSSAWALPPCVDLLSCCTLIFAVISSTMFPPQLNFIHVISCITVKSFVICTLSGILCLLFLVMLTKSACCFITDYCTSLKFCS